MKKESGVDKNIYTKYAFEDHIWATNSNNQLIADLRELTEYISKIDGEYFIYNPDTLGWSRFKDQDAKKHAFNIFLNYTLPNGSVVTQELIETYFSGIVHYLDSATGLVKKNDSMGIIGSCPQVDAIMSIPIGPKFIAYSGKRYLNEWRDNSLAGNELHLPYGKLMLRLVYRSLCNGDLLNEDSKIEADMIWEQVKADTYTNDDFKFVMKWLAALVQRPGINLLTNLWFVGELQGNGKGTLISLMKLIMGNSAVGGLSSSDIMKGWNDHLVGKQLIEVNEFDDEGQKFDWDRWVKSHCNEPTLLINKRNTTPFAIINTANYIFTTNNECPIKIGPSDRRNQFIKTTEDPNWVRFASAIKRQTIDRPIQMAEGFAYILETVKLDLDYSNYSFINKIKKSILESVNNPVSVWLDSDDTLERNNNHSYKATVLYEQYSRWHDDHGGSDRKLSLTAWGKMMSKNKYVRKTIERNYAYYTIQNPDAVDLQAWEDVYQDIAKVLVVDDKNLKQLLTTTNTDLTLDSKDLPNPTRLEKIRAKILQDQQNDDFMDDIC